MESVKNRLKEAMRIRGLRQQDMIERYGFGSSTLSYYLSGERTNPTTKMVYKLAAALDVRPDWLMGLDVPMEPTEAMEMTKKEKDMLLLFRSLDLTDREKIIERMETFLEADKYDKKETAVG